MSKLGVSTSQGILVDNVVASPVDHYEYKFRLRWILTIVLIILVILLYVWWNVTRDNPVTYSDIVEHYKYGSVGAEPGGTIFTTVGGMLPPYWIFKTLPQICPDKLPGGYAAYGFLYEQGHDLPIGVSRRRRLGVEQVGLNCAFCHTGTVRGAPGDQTRIIPGMPAHQLDLQGFLAGLVGCSIDPRLTADNVLAKVKESGGSMSFMERLILPITIKSVKNTTQELANKIGILLRTPTPWGRGRVDTFNPYKAIQLNWDLTRLPSEELIGAADYPQLWNQAPREGMHLHFDGNNTSVAERNFSAALGAGVVPTTVDYEGLYRIRDWILHLAPPKYPWEIDSARAARGKPIYEKECSSCHSFGSAQVGTVEPIESVKTDPYRLNAYTYIFSTNQWALYPESPQRVTHFQKTYGYTNQPLDGAWARAPYLHNGSVPTMWDLLMDPEYRPKSFYRGYDVYDKKNMGFITSGPEAEKAGSLFDTSLKGNGKGGHLWGVNLTNDQKWDLIEYMKTL